MARQINVVKDQPIILSRLALIGLLQGSLAARHLYPCSAGRDYLVFDPQGGVAKCQMDIQNTITDCFDNDLLAAVRKDKTGFSNLAVTEKHECRDCNWRYACTGRCPLQTFYATDSTDNPSPNCSIYKTLFPQVIQLETLRRMKDR